MYYVFDEEIFVLCFDLEVFLVDAFTVPYDHSRVLSMEMDLSMAPLVLSTAMAFWMEMVLILDFSLKLVYVFTIGGLGR